MVYLKIPVGNNAHEDTQHNIIYMYTLGILATIEKIYSSCMQTTISITGLHIRTAAV